jgi:hypothetical protein
MHSVTILPVMPNVIDLSVIMIGAVAPDYMSVSNACKQLVSLLLRLIVIST